MNCSYLSEVERAMCGKLEIYSFTFLPKSSNGIAPAYVCVVFLGLLSHRELTTFTPLLPLSHH